MLIKSVKIENYRSLCNVSIKNLNNFVVFIGKNSSGKPNLLEAVWLFMKDFSLLPIKVPINSPLEGNELLWLEGITDSPIKYILILNFLKKRC